MIRSMSIRRPAVSRTIPSSHSTSLFPATKPFTSFPQHFDAGFGPIPVTIPPATSYFSSLGATANDGADERAPIPLDVSEAPKSLGRNDSSLQDDPLEMACPKDPHSPDFANASQRQVERDKGGALRERTHFFIHKVQNGSFSDEMWKEAVEVVHHWTRINKLANSPESVDQAFLLLDRLVTEQECQGFHDVSQYLLYTPLLRLVVKNWNRCVRQFHDYSLEDQALLRYEYTPMEVLERIEDYSDRSPRLQFDTDILNIILDGASRCCVVSRSGLPNMITPRTATAFAHSLFDRMDASMSDYLRNNREGEDEDGSSGGRAAPLPLGQHANPKRRGLVPSTRPDYVTYSSMIYLFALHGLAGRAELLLDKLYKKYTKSQNQRYKPDVTMFTQALLAWARSDDPNAGERAEAILRRMQEVSECGVTDLEPDAITYSVVLNCWANGTDFRRDSANAERSMKRALLLFHEMKEKGMVCTRSYNVMLNILGKAGRPWEAEALYKSMVQDYENGIGDVRPDNVALNTILAAWSRDPSGKKAKGGKRAMRIFEDYERLYQEGKVTDPPNLISYNNVIHCLARAGQPEPAEELLEKMKTLQEVHGVSIAPDLISWNSVIDAYAKAKNPRRAEALLEQMYQEFISLEGKKSHMRPDIKTFCSVLDAWRASGEPTAAKRAEAILKTMHSLSDAGILKVTPTSIAYFIVLACWVKSEDKDAPKRAEGILNIMEDMFQKGSSTVRPDAHAYYSVIAFYGERNLASDAERVLERHHKQSLPAALGGGGNVAGKPIAQSYHHVLGAYKRSLRHDAGQRAEDLYNRWQTRYDNGEVSFPPTPLSAQLVLEAWAAAATRNNVHVQRASQFLKYVCDTTPAEDFPDTTIHNFVLSLYGGYGAVAAQEHLWWMAERGSVHAKPDVRSLNIVLSILRSTRLVGATNAAEQVETLLRRVSESDLFDFRPNLESYHVLLNSLEEIQSYSAAQKAEALLEEMENIPDVTPGVREHNQLLRIWTKVSNDDAVLKADKTFRHVKSMFLAGNEEWKPSVNTFNALINAWRRSKYETKAESIRNLEAEMVVLYGEEALDSGPQDTATERVKGKQGNRCPPAQSASNYSMDSKVCI